MCCLLILIITNLTLCNSCILNYHNCLSSTEKTDCVNGSLRLTGYIAEGWLEICIDGVWGRISHKVEGKTVEFACAALGFSKIGKRLLHCCNLTL